MDSDRLRAERWAALLFAAVFASLQAPPDAAADNDGAPEGGSDDDDPAFPQDVHVAGEVVVTGRRIPAIEQAGTVTVIDREDIEAHGDTTLADVLERIPGMQVYTHTKGHQRLRMRGFDQDKVMILIDGMPINDVYSTDANLSAIPLANVARIVVNRGVSSALYGTDGAMGTINVITRKPSGPMAEVTTEYGSQDTANNTLVLGTRLGDFYLLGTGAMTHSRGFRPSRSLDAGERRRWFDRLIRYDLYPLAGPFAESGPFYTFDDVSMPSKDQYLGDEGLWNHQRTRRYQLSTKLGFSPAPDLDAGISAEYYFFTGETNTYEAYGYSSYRGDRWKPNYPYFDDEEEQTKKFALRNRSFVWPEVYRINLQPFFRGRAGPLSVNFQAFYMEQGQTEDGYASNDHSFVKGESVLLKGTGTVEPFHDHKTFGSVGLRLMPSIHFARWHRLDLAFHARADRYVGEESAISPSVSPATFSEKGGGRYTVEDLGASIFSLAVEDEMTLFERLKLSAGVSYDAQFLDYIRVLREGTLTEAYVAKDDSLLMGTRDSFNPVAGIVIDAIRSRLRFRAAGSIKTRFPTLSEYSKVEAAEVDDELKPERSYNANGGAELLFLDESVSLRSDYFASIIDDRILKFRQDDPPTNVDRLVAHGVESSLTAESVRLAGGTSLSGSLGHAFVYARYSDYDPAAGTVKGPYVEFTPEHHFSADLLLDFASGTSLETWAVLLYKQRIYVMDHRPLDTEAPYSTDYFTTADLHNPFFWNIRISQRFAEYYRASFSVLNLIDDYDMDPFNPGPGRRFFVSLSAEWE